MITDKQVEAACVAYHHCQAGWEILPRRIRLQERERIVAALEAAEAAMDAAPVGFRVSRGGIWLFASATYDASVADAHREAGATVELLYAAPSSAEQPASGAFINPQHIAADIVRSCAHSGIEVDALDVLAAVDRALPEPPTPGAPEADERGIVGLTRDLASCERALERRTIERNAFAAELDACSQYLKPGERVVDRIARELRDSASLLEMLATERAALEAARAQSSAAPSVAPVSARDGEAVTYSSTQSTACAGCGKVKHTPLRVDVMGGYVCLTCIDKKLATPPADARDGGTRTLSDEQLAAILARPVCEGESVEFCLADSCAVPAYPECTRLMMHEVIRTILAPADRATGGE